METKQITINQWNIRQLPAKKKEKIEAKFGKAQAG